MTGGIGWIAILVLGGFLFGNIPVVRRNFTLVILAIIVVSVLPGIIAVFRQQPQTPPAPRGGESV